MMLGHQKLFTAFRFLILKEEGSGRSKTLKERVSSSLSWFQWYYPTLAAGLSLYFLWKFDLFSIFEGSDNLISRVNSLLAMLIGFYIAALAAVATFQSARLEEEISGRKIFAGGQSLKRRQFLCSVFGYCTGMAIIIFVTSSVFELLSSELVQIQFVCRYMAFFQYSSAFGYLWCCFSLMFVTLLGMNYLVDRMHR